MGWFLNHRELFKGSQYSDKACKFMIETSHHENFSTWPGLRPKGEGFPKRQMPPQFHAVEEVLVAFVFLPCHAHPHTPQKTPALYIYIHI